MWYNRTMDVYEKNHDIIIENQADFIPAQIFDCGQCFRFEKEPDGSYTGTAFGVTTRISMSGNNVILHNTSLDDFDSVWRTYLDLDRDYGEIKRELCRDGDSVMTEACEYGSGIRILRQELWETLISFIISASNNIPRIKKIINLLCINFGSSHEFDGKTHYSFPTAERIAELSIDELSVIRAGFRDKYILQCAKDVAEGRLDLDQIRALLTQDAKKKLMGIYGVGNKVSDCILLFGLSRFDSYPVDVWIKRVTEYFWFDGEPQSIGTISDFAVRKFGDLGGIAQQYLFFLAREKKIGTDHEKISS